jgi:hypothetical protein
MIKDPSTESKILDFIDRDVGSNLSSRIAASFDSKNLDGMIRSGMSDHLASVVCHIVDDPRTDSMIRKKIGEEVDLKIKSK